MKKLVLVVALLTSTGCSFLLNGSGLTPPIASNKVRASIVRITEQMAGFDLATCTGMSLGNHRYLTAAHCVDTTLYVESETIFQAELFIDGTHKAHVIKYNPIVDLALIETDFTKPPVSFREEKLVWLERVFGMGYAQAFTFATVTEHTVQQVGSGAIVKNVEMNVYNHEFIGGMSGGPVFDMKGQVVGMVQRAGNGAGFGVGTETMLKFISNTN